MSFLVANESESRALVKEEGQEKRVASSRKQRRQEKASIWSVFEP